MLGNSAAFSGFSVDDIPRAKQFYADTLGLEVSEENDILTLNLGGGATAIAYPKGDQHQPASFTILNFPVPEIEAAVRETEGSRCHLRALRGHARGDRRARRLPGRRTADRVVQGSGRQRLVGDPGFARPLTASDRPGRGDDREPAGQCPSVGAEPIHRSKEASPEPIR